MVNRAKTHCPKNNTARRGYRCNARMRLYAGWGVSAMVLAMVIGTVVYADQPDPYLRAIDDPHRKQKSIVLAIDDPLEQQKTTVRDVFGEYAIRGTKIHSASIRSMINTGITKLADRSDPNQAWRRFIHDEDIVALKFTRVGSQALGTNHSLAVLLLQCLEHAGFQRDRIMIVGLDNWNPQQHGTRPWNYGWQKKQADLGSDHDYLAQWLDEVTAIINIPSIMDDNIIGLRCALANLSLPLLKRPARLYKNRGDPFIVEVYDLPQIRGKVRLHIANALRILYYGGPHVHPTYTYERGTLIFSRDGVALDRVALEILHTLRRDQPMPPNVSDRLFAPYLDTAYAMGLGYNDLNFIEYQRTNLDKW